MMQKLLRAQGWNWSWWPIGLQWLQPCLILAVSYEFFHYEWSEIVFIFVLTLDIRTDARITFSNCALMNVIFQSPRSTSFLCIMEPSSLLIYALCICQFCTFSCKATEFSRIKFAGYNENHWSNLCTAFTWLNKNSKESVGELNVVFQHYDCLIRLRPGMYH